MSVQLNISKFSSNPNHYIYQVIRYNKIITVDEYHEINRKIRRESINSVYFTFSIRIYSSL